MCRGRVFLTGASGFLGSHVAEQLLQAGYAIKACFRTEAKCRQFEKHFSSSLPPSLVKGEETAVETCIVPDITAPGAFRDVLSDEAGCTSVVHCASPFTFQVDDIQTDLIDPAVKGTMEILGAIAKTQTVRRLVLTSSFAAVVDPTKGPRPGCVYTESDWNPVTPEMSKESHLFGYQASKTFSERAAWDFVSSLNDTAAEKREKKMKPRRRRPELSLVTICPPMIFGPVHPAIMATTASLNESSAQLVTNAVKTQTAPPPTRMPVWVDVRDVASIHVKSLDSDAIPTSERYLVCAGKFTWAAVRDIYQKGSASASSLASSGEYYSIDARKAERTFFGSGSWIPLEKSVLDCVESLGISQEVAKF